MSAHLPGFQLFFLDFLHNFVLTKLATSSSIRVKERKGNIAMIYYPLRLPEQQLRLWPSSLRLIAYSRQIRELTTHLYLLPILVLSCREKRVKFPLTPGFV